MPLVIEKSAMLENIVMIDKTNAIFVVSISVISILNNLFMTLCIVKP